VYLVCAWGNSEPNAKREVTQVENLCYCPGWVTGVAARSMAALSRCCRSTSVTLPPSTVVTWNASTTWSS